MKTKKANRPTPKPSNLEGQVSPTQSDADLKRELMRMVSSITATVELHYGPTRSGRFEVVAVELKQQLERRIGEVLQAGHFTLTINGTTVCPDVRNVSVKRL